MQSFQFYLERVNEELAPNFRGYEDPKDYNSKANLNIYKAINIIKEAQSAAFNDRKIFTYLKQALEYLREVYPEHQPLKPVLRPALRSIN